MEGIETYWIWLIIGLALAALEMIVPGVYLIWLAMAALAIAVLAFVSAPPLALQIIAWVSLSLISPFRPSAGCVTVRSSHPIRCSTTAPGGWWVRRRW